MQNHSYTFLTAEPNVTLFTELFFIFFRATEKMPMNPYNHWVYTDYLLTPNVTLV